VNPGTSLPAEDAFAPFVPRWVRERIGSGRPLGDEVELSLSQAGLLLADLSGFTSFAAEACARKDRGAEQVQEVLNSCFGRLADHVQAFGGEVLAFPGDAALGFWPLTDAVAANDAVSAAAACARKILSDVDGSLAPGGFALRLRVAVSAGPIWQALVGGEGHCWESLVGGAAVEQLAATLARARPGDGVLSPGAARILGLPAWSSVPAAACPQAPRGGGPLVLGAALEPALRRFIPRTVQARIDAGQTDWLAEFRRVSAMFVRLTGLPDPASDAAPLQAITRAVQSAVFGFGGSVVQFVVDDKGPTLLAAWGIAHHVHEDDAVRAVCAGLAVERALRELGTPGAIGIATGRVWTGRRGSASRSEFAMIGDTVNLAARLMQASESTTLCDEATMR
jgi:class 3 adenylate cyclase